MKDIEKCIELREEGNTRFSEYFNLITEIVKKQSDRTIFVFFLTDGLISDKDIAVNIAL